MDNPIKEAYKEWWHQQPCHQQIETMEEHVSRFVRWLVVEKGMVIETVTLQQEAA